MILLGFYRILLISCTAANGILTKVEFNKMVNLDISRRIVTRNVDFLSDQCKKCLDELGGLNKLLQNAKLCNKDTENYLNETICIFKQKVVRSNNLIKMSEEEITLNPDSENNKDIKEMLTWHKKHNDELLKLIEIEKSKIENNVNGESFAYQMHLSLLGRKSSCQKVEGLIDEIDIRLSGICCFVSEPKKILEKGCAIQMINECNNCSEQLLCEIVKCFEKINMSKEELRYGIRI